MENPAAEHISQSKLSGEQQKHMSVSSDPPFLLLLPIIPRADDRAPVLSKRTDRCTDRRPHIENTIRNASHTRPCETRPDAVGSFPSPEHVVTKQFNPGLVE